MQTTSISNRSYNGLFNQKPCNPRAHETCHPLCWPLLCYSQDRTLSLRIRLTFKYLHPFYLPYLPAEAITSTIGSTMAFGYQYSTIIPTEANFQKKNPKSPKKLKKIKSKNLAMKKVKRCLKLNTF